MYIVECPAQKSIIFVHARAVAGLHHDVSYYYEQVSDAQ